MKKLLLLFITVSSLSSCTINRFNGGTHHHYNYQPIDINPKSERAQIWDRLNDQSLNQSPIKYNTTIKVDANGNTYTDTEAK